MIQRMSHTAIFVPDQDQAKDFYVGKLGFEVKTDATMPNGFRWLTVSPKGQPELQPHRVAVCVCRPAPRSNPCARERGRRCDRFHCPLR